MAVGWSKPVEKPRAWSMVWLWWFNGSFFVDLDMDYLWDKWALHVPRLPSYMAQLGWETQQT